MKVSIMQPYFFPYIGYFQLINYSDKFINYDDVNYIKGGWINRNKILSNNSEIYFNADVSNNKSSSLISDVFYKEKHSSKKIKTIYYSYNKEKNFKNAFPVIEKCLNYKCKNISELNIYIIKQICKYLYIDTEIQDTSKIYNNKHLTKQDRVIDICKKENCTEYINTSGGIKLYSKKDFLNHQIKLNFIKCKIEKPPLNLSIIHLLMTMDKKRIVDMLEEYVLL